MTAMMGSRPSLACCLALGLVGASPGLAGGGEAEREARRRAIFETMEQMAPAAPGGTLDATWRGAELPPPSVGRPLDPRFVELGEELAAPATADWKRRLAERGGRATLVPLTPVEPTRPLLLLVPGRGMNFQDLHAMAELDDTYQVLVGVADETRSMEDDGRDLADALEDLMAWRGRVVARRGLGADRSLRVIGHSFGAASALLALGALNERGRLDAAAGGLFERVQFYGIDGPWRGLDLPWFALVPGVKQLGGWLLPRLPLPARVDRGILSMLTCSGSMGELARLTLPPCVTTQLVTVVGKLDTSSTLRQFEPVANWYSAELGAGELKRLWRYFRDGALDEGRLPGWNLKTLTKKKGLESLLLTLARDRDYAAVAPDMVAAARAAAGPEEFAPRWDELLGRVVDTFAGHHTKFMWTDPRFLPWLRGALAGGTLSDGALADGTPGR